MRLRSLELSGFRGFGRSARVDLDADTVILVGANGSGKTSLFDGLMWALSGQLPRVEDEGGTVVSEYASSDEARVELDLRLARGGAMRVTRSCIRNDEPRLRIELDGKVMRGQEAQVALYRELWPDALSAPDGPTALLLALTRSVYLQQDLVREFVEADSDTERFEAVSELVGVGRIRELQVQLDKARRAWTTATNKLASEAAPREARLRKLDEQLTHLSAESGSSEIAAAWAQWWTQTSELLSEHASVPNLSSPDAPSLIDQALRRIAAERRRNDRQLLEAEAARNEIVEERDTAGESGPSVEALLSELETLRARTQIAEKNLDLARQRQEQVREAALQAEERVAQLGALAQLALQHLEGRCPVCDQEHEMEHTVAHLHRLLETEPVREGISRQEDNLDTLATQARELRASSRTLEARVEERRAQAHAQELQVAQRTQRLASFGISGVDDVESELERVIARLSETTGRLVAQRDEGERLALALAKTAEASRRKELRKEREKLAGPLTRELTDIEERRATGDLATQIFEALRESVTGLVDAQLDQISPLVARVYARIDPHPAFREVELSSKFEHGRGRVKTTVRDTLGDVSVARPGTVLSSSQLNALAASIFLALNLSIAKPPLDAVLLDDPLQSLDDVNLLGLVDLLRRTKQRRQLLISTHDPRFAELLKRKLRPGADGRTLVLELSGWTRPGPQIVETELSPEPSRLRLVA